MHLQKKEFTSFDVCAASRELRTTLVGSRINNIYQLDSATLLSKLHKPNEPSFQMILQAGKRLHLTFYVAEKPHRPSAFCMALRKYLRNAWLTDIEQHEFERVIVFSLKSWAGTLRLILELFGDGNIILIDGENHILQALVYKQMRDRNILRGEPFIFAPSTGRNPLKVDYAELSDALKASGDVEAVRAIARLLSIGGLYSEETLLRAGVEKTKRCSALSDSEIKAIYESLTKLVSQAMDGKLDACIVLGNCGSFVDVVPFKLERYKVEGLGFKAYGNFNEALDEFYTRVIATERAIAELEVDKSRNEAERLGRIIAEQERGLTEAEARAKLNKRIGDAIYAQMVDLQVLLDRFQAGKEAGETLKSVAAELKAEKEKGIGPAVLFDSIDSRGLAVTVSVGDLAFSLDIRRTLFENAAWFYEQAKRDRQKLHGAEVALAGSRKKLAELVEKIKEAEELERGKQAETVWNLEKQKVKHRKWYEKFRWFITSDGFLVVAGRDAVSNEILVKKYTEENDLVFHADVVGAPFVVVKTGDRDPSEQCFNEAGEFAAAFSRGWREGFGSIDVYCVKPEQLRKAGPSGQSVGRGAFVVRGERKWLRGVGLKLAIGILMDEDGRPRVVGGPVNAVKAKTEIYIAIVPGDLIGEKLFRLILNTLAGKASREFREGVSRVSDEELREYVPYGKGKVLENRQMRI
jgi:predicted ribosome quality control (RQC) complex YloA/Tae2 family protein